MIYDIVRILTHTLTCTHSYTYTHKNEKMQLKKKKAKQNRMLGMAGISEHPETVCGNSAVERVVQAADTEEAGERGDGGAHRAKLPGGETGHGAQVTGKVRAMHSLFLTNIFQFRSTKRSGALRGLTQNSILVS